MSLHKRMHLVTGEFATEIPWFYDLTYDRYRHSMVITVKREMWNLLVPVISEKNGDWYSRIRTRQYVPTLLHICFALPQLPGLMERDHTWHLPLERISRDIDLLCAALQYIVEETPEAFDESKAQLIALPGLASYNSPGGWGFAPWIFPALRDWVRREGMNVSEHVMQVMFDTYSHMSELSKDMRRAFSFHVEEEFLHMAALGNCACLGVAGEEKQWLREKRGPYQLAPHNIDSPLQQFSLLAGLGKIIRLARAAGY